MFDPVELLSLAFHAEKVASRRLARRSSITEEAALRHTLETVAGANGLAALLETRRTTRAANTARSAARDARAARAKEKRRTRHDGPATPWRAWFDGSAHPNPGRCGIGGLLLGPGGERIEIFRPAGYGNSSEAEYQALVAVLAAALGVGASELTVYGDSQVVIHDVACTPLTGAPALAEWRTAAQAVMQQLNKVSLRWVPRHKNPEADALSQRAILAWVGDAENG